jgi:hypothetical protein
MKIGLILLLALFFMLPSVRAQMGGVAKITSEKRRQQLIDSLKNTPYPYVFPILGDKVRKKGITLPLPHGIMVNYLPGTQNIAMSDLAVGFNHESKYDLSEIVTFENVKANMQIVNVRPDTWVLPFLNIYGLAGYASGDINVHLSAPVDFTTVQKVQGPFFGLGAMLTGAISGIFIANDYNYSWSFNERLDKPATIFMTGLRAGPVIRFKEKREMNVTFWGGFAYSSLNSKTTGSIDFKDVFTDAGTNMDEAQAKLDAWYQEAYDGARTESKKEAIQALYDKTSGAITRIKNGVDAGSIQYEMQKSFNKPFNCLAGAQWQINNVWQLRSEYQFLGDRKLLLLSVMYRFGIKGKTLFSK